MTSEAKLEQKAFRTRIGYRFFEDHVDYSIRDSGGNRASFSARYRDLPSKFEYRVFQPRKYVLPIAALRIMGLALVVIVLSPWHSFWELSAVAVSGGILIGVLTLIGRHREKIYTAIPTRNGKLLVLCDKRHDDILRELESRRLLPLGKLTEINAQNDPAAELRKFLWLKEEGVISEQDLNVYARALGLGPSALPAPESPPLVIHQRSFRYDAEFTFHSRDLSYATNDGAHAGFNVRYASLPASIDYSTFLKGDTMTIRLTIGAGLLVGLALLYLYADDNGIEIEDLAYLTKGALFFCLGLSALVYAVHRYSRRKFTIISAGISTVRVLQGAQHDRILELIKQHRRETLRAFAVIDFSKPPLEELNKITWLKDQGRYQR
jgi:hypothetical protein